MTEFSKVDGRDIEIDKNGDWVFSDTKEHIILMESLCMDCFKPYKDFGLDMLFPNEQWEMIHPEVDGTLCASCMVKRASKLKHVLVVRAFIEFAQNSYSNIKNSDTELEL